MDFSRYAIYFAPSGDDAWARFATAWLGWDMASGMPVAHPDLPGLPLPVEEITATPRRYGLHGTIKPPFQLAPGQDRAALETACAELCASCAPLRIDGPVVTRLGGFLALCPSSPAPALNDLAAACVSGVDEFRARPEEHELARRRATGLSPRQEQNLMRWGYPYVMDEFRFHMTLTGRLPRGQADAVQTILTAALDPLLPGQMTIDNLALAGEDADGLFHLLRRFPLTG